MSEITDYIGCYADQALEPASRFASWQACYEYFGQGITSDRRTVLELGFYLASWGMYRGSGFLLQRDATVHEGVAEILQKPEYRGLHGHAPSHTVDVQIKAILALYQEIQDHYETWSAKVSTKDGKPHHASKTLVTKNHAGNNRVYPGV